MRKMTAYGAFARFVEDNGRYPTLDEFKDMGYSRATYYRCKQAYQPTEPEEYGYAERKNAEIWDNGIITVDLKF